MLPNRIRIPNHLILPFGTARKLDLQKIKLSSVAANGIYLTSDIPCVYIDRAQNLPLTMQNYDVLLLDHSSPEPNDDDVLTGLNFICDLVKGCMPSDTTTEYERIFLTIYFEWLKERVSEDAYPPLTEPFSLFNALLPIPQMQLYVHDPLEDDWSGRFEPTNNFRVDFGFWTGTKLIAVEIDGKEPEGYARDIRRDRLLRRAEVDVIHILNTEIAKHGKRVVAEILPHDITYDWRTRPAPRWTPFIPF